MVLALLAPLVLAADVERLAVDRPFGESMIVAGADLAGDDVQADAADARRGAGEVLVDYFLAQADRLENLRAQ